MGSQRVAASLPSLRPQGERHGAVHALEEIWAHQQLDALQLALHGPWRLGEGLEKGIERFTELGRPQVAVLG